MFFDIIIWCTESNRTRFIAVYMVSAFKMFVWKKVQCNLNLLSFFKPVNFYHSGITSHETIFNTEHIYVLVCFCGGYGGLRYLMCVIVFAFPKRQNITGNKVCKRKKWKRKHCKYLNAWMNKGSFHNFSNLLLFCLTRTLYSWLRRSQKCCTKQRFFHEISFTIFHTQSGQNIT